MIDFFNKLEEKEEFENIPQNSIVSNIEGNKMNVLYNDNIKNNDVPVNVSIIDILQKLNTIGRKEIKSLDDKKYEDVIKKLNGYEVFKLKTFSDELFFKDIYNYYNSKIKTIPENGNTKDVVTLKSLENKLKDFVNLYFNLL